MIVKRPELIASRAAAIASLIEQHPGLPLPTFTIYPYGGDVPAQLADRDELMAWAKAFSIRPSIMAYEGRHLGEGSMWFAVTHSGVKLRVWAHVELAKVPDALLRVITAPWRDCGGCGYSPSAQRCESCRRADVAEDRSNDEVAARSK